jgi:hypothetical protein
MRLVFSTLIATPKPDEKSREGRVVKVGEGLLAKDEDDDMWQ